jgi:hypothetical protein
MNSNIDHKESSDEEHHVKDEQIFPSGDIAGKEEELSYFEITKLNIRKLI